MFKNLPTGTKLLILCGVFAIIIAVPISDLITEKQVAIDVTRKELAGTRYLVALQGIYAAILTSQLSDRPTGQPESTDKALKALMAVEVESANTLQTAELEQALTETLRELWSPKAARSTIDIYLVDALALARDLISRVGDDSKLAIDPELDSYYLQSIVVRRLPSLMGQLGETHTLFRTAAAAGGLSSEQRTWIEFSTGSSLQNRTAWGWDWLSADRSWKPIMVVFGQSRPSIMAQSSAFGCLLQQLPSVVMTTRQRQARYSFSRSPIVIARRSRSPMS
jgi:hypothetical protein